ncbi:MAG: hypothetical protein HPY85_16060 [Anaerolineae bacterium]|nr:hypothetical protein [Anaerolineae bacterium]
MQNLWDVNTARAHVAERHAVLAGNLVPAAARNPRKELLKRLRTRFLSLFWL